MPVAQLQVTFVLHGCTSLKDKRRRLSRLRDKFGKQTAVAVCEADFADALHHARWVFVVAASSAKIVEQILSDIESYVSVSIDAEVSALQRDWLV